MITKRPGDSRSYVQSGRMKPRENRPAPSKHPRCEQCGELTGQEWVGDKDGMTIYHFCYNLKCIHYGRYRMADA